MALSREKAFQTSAWSMLILVSVYTSARVLRDSKSYTQLFSSTTMLPQGLSFMVLVVCSLTQIGGALALLWPRLDTIRNGKFVALSVLCGAFALQIIVAFASATGRTRTVALVVASFLHVVREGSSRSSSQVGVDVEESLCDRVYGRIREAATRYKAAAVVVVLMISYFGFYMYYSQSIIFARHRLQREIGVEQMVDLFGLFTLLLTVGSFQQNRRVLFTPLDLEDDEAVGRVARAKRVLSGLATRAWEGRGAKKSFKDL